jgi:hypothetical protein
MMYFIINMVLGAIAVVFDSGTQKDVKDRVQIYCS